MPNLRQTKLFLAVASSLQRANASIHPQTCKRGFSWQVAPEVLRLSPALAKCQASFTDTGWFYTSTRIARARNAMFFTCEGQ
eukprot:s1007_g5.t1